MASLRTHKTNTKSRLSKLTMKRIDLKPLSVNDAWRGRKFSTPAKKTYERRVKQELEWCILEDCIAPYEIHFKFWIPKLQDYDNCIKVTQDILCEHFWINDRDIYKAVIEKVPVKAWQEYFEIEILTYKFK